MTDNVYLGIDVSMNLENNDIEFGTNNDFKLKNNNDNLIQAIVNRLKTYKGEITEHPEYGSKLNDLIGSAGSAITLIEARQIVLAALLQEPRIQEGGIVEISPSFVENTNNQMMSIAITVLPIESQVPLNMVFPFILTEG